VMPLHLARRHQRESGFDPFAHMSPKMIIICRREMDQRARADILLAKWMAKDIDNSKE